LKQHRTSALYCPRAYAALLIVIVAYFLSDTCETTLYHVLVHTFGPHRSAPNTLGEATYGTLMVVRLVWNGTLWLAVCATLRRSPGDFPMGGQKIFRYVLLGFVTGLTVMLAAMLGILALKSAAVSAPQQSWTSSLENGFKWVLLDFLGALGEEIYGRAVILIVVERFLGPRGAILISGVMFSGLHFSNPGMSWIWLLRLFCQGMLLAYAVFRTDSLGWSVGYHTGWNWVSAPLLGAVGSGYMDEGHIFEFHPHGSIWITGGSVGPEGSILAFLAVFTALGILLLTTPSRHVA
jgi:CAAX protease family protein